MASYTTTSGFPDLDGSIVIDSNSKVKSYTSTRLGRGTVRPIDPPVTQFSVKFRTSRTYHITATANGTGFRGDADDNRSGAG